MHLASDQKDLLISQLKAEIFEIEQRDKDYLALRDQLYTIQTKYRHLQDEKLLQDNDFKTRSDSNMLTLQGLKKEIDDTRFLLNEKNRSNNDLQAEIASTREQISRREAEIFATQRDVAQKTDSGHALRKEIDNASYELAKLKEERARDQEEIERAKDLNVLKTRENTDQDARIKAVDYDLYKAQERATELAKQADAREFELRRTTEAYEAASADLMRARDEQARNNEESSQLTRALDLKMTEKSELVRRSEGELARNRDLSSNLYDLEGKNRGADDNLTANRREQDDLRFQTQSMNNANADCRAEVDALQHHCNVLAGQNVELNAELERFVNTDEQIRQTLNRRERVETLRNKTETEMRASYAHLERSSPRRRH